MDRYGTVWDDLMNRLNESSVFFMQIGANDGMLHDPLQAYVKRFRWEGILIEPVPTYFESLVKNYRGIDNLTLLNVAISPEGDNVPLPFYAVEGVKDAPHDFFTGLSSFDRSVILSHRRDFPALEEYITEIEVQSRTITGIFRDNNVKSVDLVVVDAEGFDGKIIKSFPFDTHRPKIVYFEDKHLSRDDSESTLALLRDNEYSVIRIDWNWCALREDVMSAREANLLGKFLL